MSRLAVALATLSISSSALAHVTPNVTLVRRGDFVKEALPGASQYFEQFLDGPAAIESVRAATGWSPTAEEARIYVGKDGQGRALGRVVFLWLPSEHGPVGIGVAFDPTGRIRRATVTDVGTEPLVWVRPLLDRFAALSDIGPDVIPEPAALAPASSGRMVLYYAEVIVGGLRRAQAIDRVLRAATELSRTEHP
jgi:hypothetical protein